MAENQRKRNKVVAPWRPFMGITGWERDMDRMLDDFLAGEHGHGGPNDGLEPMIWR